MRHHSGTDVRSTPLIRILTLSAALAAGTVCHASALRAADPAFSAAAAPEQARRGTPLPPVLAKAKLAEAQAEARKWRADAVLIQIAGSAVSADGKKPVWDYGYYSASAKNCLVVNVTSAAYGRESGGPTCAADVLPADFIDSDRVMQIANANGMQGKPVNLAVSIARTPKGNAPVWMVIDRSAAGGMFSLDVDGRTGAVLNKR